MSDGKSQKDRARVRALLLHEWDPIGIQEFPGASDEYDTYADRAYAMLMDEGATAATISSYLFEIATRQMGLSDHARLAGLCEHTANALVQMRPEFDAD